MTQYIMIVYCRDWMVLELVTMLYLGLRTICLRLCLHGSVSEVVATLCLLESTCM